MDNGISVNQLSIKTQKKKEREGGGAHPKSTTLLQVGNQEASDDVCVAFSLCFGIVRLQDLFGTSVSVNLNQKWRKRNTTKSFRGKKK